MSTAIDYQAPVIAASMRRVDRVEFYARMNPLNVHPSIPGRWNDATGYVSEWTMQDGSRRIIGVSDGGTHLCAKRYWLA